MTLSPDVLARIHAAAFGTTRPWSAQEFESLLKTPGMILCGDARSFLLGRVIAGEAEVLTVATDPAFQRQGHGRKCLRDFLIAAENASAETIFLEVAEDNEPAKSLYFNEGFEISGQRPNYYQSSDGRNVAALMMRKSLNLYTDADVPPEN